MSLLDHRTLGIVILVLLAALAIVKQIASGSIFKDKPRHTFWLRLTHVFNLVFLFVATPLAGILLIVGAEHILDPFRLPVATSWLVTILESVGIVFYTGGYFLMAWALIKLSRNYQIGGSIPRATDEMVVVGPYKYVRHPIYTAALCISFGLACLIQSLTYSLLFCAYIVLILRLIPVEEDELRRAYGEQYAAYQQKVRALAPCLPRSPGNRK